MKRLRIEHITAWLLLVILGLIVIHAPLTVFIESRWPGIGDVAKAWKELLLLVALVLVCIECTRQTAWRRFANDKLLWIALAYAVLHGVIALAGSTGTMPTIAGLMIDLRYIAYFMAVYVFLQLHPSYRQSFLRVGLVGAVVVIGFAALQQVLPRDFLHYVGYSDATIKPYLTVDENPDFVRHSSTLRGPNPLGAYAVIVLTGVVAVARLIQGKRALYIQAALGVGALIALWTSQSRSAWIAAFASVAIVLIVRHWRAFSRQFAGIAIIAAVLLAVGVYAIRDTNFYHNAILHDNPSTGAAVDSNAGHLSSLTNATAKMLHNPLGSGIGSTGSASLYGDKPFIIENQYLFIAHEAGWLGLALFLLLLGIIMVRLWRARGDWMALGLFASGIGLAIIGLLLPVWVDDTISIVWWGLAAVLLAKEGVGHGKQTNKKAKRTA